MYSFFIFFSIMVHHRILNSSLRYIYSRTLLFIHSNYASLHLLILNSQSIPPPPPWQPQDCCLCLWVCLSLVYLFMCVIFQIPQRSGIIWYLFLSDLLPLVWLSLGLSMLLQMALFHFLWLSNVPLWLYTVSYLFIQHLISFVFVENCLSQTPSLSGVTWESPLLCEPCRFYIALHPLLGNSLHLVPAWSNFILDSMSFFFFVFTLILIEHIFQ